MSKGSLYELTPDEQRAFDAWAQAGTQSAQPDNSAQPATDTPQIQSYSSPVTDAQSQFPSAPAAPVSLGNGAQAINATTPTEAPAPDLNVYDASGNVIPIGSRQSDSAKYQYDANGNLLAYRTNANQPFTYTPAGQQTIAPTEPSAAQQANPGSPYAPQAPSVTSSGSYPTEVNPLTGQQGPVYDTAPNDNPYGPMYAANPYTPADNLPPIGGDYSPVPSYTASTPVQSYSQPTDLIYSQPGMETPTYDNTSYAPNYQAYDPSTLSYLNQRGVDAYGPLNPSNQNQEVVYAPPAAPQAPVSYQEGGSFGTGLTGDGSS